MKKAAALFLFLILNNYQSTAQSFSPLGQGFDFAEVRCLYADTANNLLYAGGSFGYSGTTKVNGISVWNGVMWDSLAGGTDNSANVFSILNYNDTLLACGTFTYMNGLNVKGSANWDGNFWYPFINASAYGYGGICKARIIDSNLYLVGVFDTVSTIRSFKIAYYDGISWNAFPPLDTTDGGFAFLDVIKFNNEIYVCGNFEGNTIPNTKDVAKFNGTTWTDVGGGLTGFFTGAGSFAIYNGELYMAGSFGFPFSSDPYNNIMKWDGNNWSDVGGGVDVTIFAMHVFNGELYVGGVFQNVAGGTIPAPGLAKWDGTQWHTIPGLVSIDNAVESFADMNGKLYIGGAFFHINGIPMNKVAVYDPLTGIQQNEWQNQLSIYPNIANEYITIQNPKNHNLTFQLTDTQGRKVTDQLSSSAAVIKLPVSHLQQGMYLLNCKNNNGSLTKKIIVSKN